MRTNTAFDQPTSAGAGRGRPGRLRIARWLHVVVSIVIVGSAVHIEIARAATTYRCETAGQVTYSDLPCDAGKATVIGGVRGPSSMDRADALDRARTDEARLSAIERERRQDERAAALARRRGTDIGKHVKACDKLAKAARKAHDDADLAGPRDQAKLRLRMQRADEDYAALCKVKR